MTRDRGLTERLPRVGHLWLEHPSVDVVMAAATSFGLAFASRRWEWLDVLGPMLPAVRGSLLTDLITISGIFVGFSGTGLAAYLGLSGNTSIQRLQTVAHQAILRQWRSAIAGSGFLVFLFIMCKALDPGTPSVYAWVTVGGFLLLGLRAFRMVYVFVQLTSIATGPGFERSSSDRPNHLRSTG